MQGITFPAESLQHAREIFPTLIPSLHPTFLVASCRAGQLDIVKFLIEEMGVSAHTRVFPYSVDSNRKSPLHQACLGGHLDVVRYLVKECKVDPNSTGGGVQPLYMACYKGHLPVVKFLIDEAQVSPTDTFGQSYNTPMYIACRDGHLDMVKYLFEIPEVRERINKVRGHSEVPPLGIAAYMNNSSVVEFLASQPCVNVNLVDNGWMTPLIRACHMGSCESVEILVRNPRVKTTISPMVTLNVTPLYAAVRQGCYRTVKVLIASGHPLGLDGGSRESRTKLIAAIREARERGEKRTTELLDAYQRNPRAATLSMRKELGWIDQDAADTFALIIFHCDRLTELVEIK